MSIFFMNVWFKSSYSIGALEDSTIRNTISQTACIFHCRDDLPVETTIHLSVSILCSEDTCNMKNEAVNMFKLLGMDKLH